MKVNYKNFQINCNNSNELYIIVAAIEKLPHKFHKPIKITTNKILAPWSIWHKVYGYCDYQNGEIFVHIKNHNKNELELYCTVIHELFHGLAEELKLKQNRRFVTWYKKATKNTKLYCNNIWEDLAETASRIVIGSNRYNSRKYVMKKFKLIGE